MRNLLLLLFIYLAIFANARQITPDEATSIAAEFLNSSASVQKTGMRVNVRRLQSPKASRNIEENQPYYVFNATDDKGFVIISGDDRAKKILGYSDKGNFDFNNIPPQLAVLLDQYAKQIETLPATGAADSSWSKASRVASDGEGVLLETANWGQGYPYNAQCPIIDGVQTPTGCVATAMAIVMKYHNWPEQGRHSHKYNTNPFGTSLDEMNYGDIEFDYNLMEQEGNTEIAALMRASGHSVNMVYGENLSGTFVWLVSHSLQRFFKYSPDCQYIEKSHFSYNEWNDIILSQLNNGYPIIYSGFTQEKDGHAFIIDGYKKDMFHINWGWDGLSNGYFSLNSTNEEYIPEYNERQGMIINIIPDKSGKEYSPCWIDYGYLWREVDSDPLLMVNPGTYVYSQKYEKGKPFDFYSKTINVPVDYPCSFGIAVVDKDENIVSVAPAYMLIGEGSYYLFCTINYTWGGVTLSTSTSIDVDLPEDYTLWVASQKQGSNNWELVLGTMEAPSKCRFEEKEIPLSKIEHSFSNIDGYLGNPDNDEKEFVYSVNKTNPLQSILGSTYCATYKANNGIANIYLNGEWATNTDDVSRTSLQFKVLTNYYDIDVEYISNDELNDVSLKNVSAGSLKELLNDCEKIKSLTIQGTLNAEDLSYITQNCLSLQHLDLSEVTISSSSDYSGDDYPKNFYPKNNFRPIKTLNDNSNSTCNIWSVKSLLLPKSMRGWIGNGIELGGRNMAVLSMPVDHVTEGTEYYIDGQASSGDYSYQFVNCIVNDITSPISQVNFPDLVKTYGHLFVPKGMKNKFLESNGWSDFKYIIEVDRPFVGKIIEKDGAQYILLSDCAVLLAVPFDKFHSHFSVADKIEYNDETFPVKYLASQSMLHKDIRFIELPEYLEDLDLNIFFGSASITLNKNLRNIVPQNDIYHVAGVLYLRNEKTLNLSMMDSFEAFSEKIVPNFITDQLLSTVYIPGEAYKNYNAIMKGSARLVEMWNYEIDKINGIVKIEPLIEGLSIDEVVINGNHTDVNATNIYEYDKENAPDLDVIVEFTLHDRQKMTTHYDAEFNAKLPSTDLTQVDRIVLSSQELTLFIGQTTQLTATILPENVANKTLEWTSSNENVATVDADGMVTAVGLGDAIITTTDGSSVSANCTVTVIPTLAKSLTIAPEIWNGVKGETFQITAEILPENTTDKTLNWSSSDETIATVNAAGLVSVLMAGSCRITATTTDGSNLTAECKLDVLSGIEEIFSDGATTVDVYNTQGVLIKKNCTKQELNQFSSGIYIMCGATEAIRIFIK